MEFKDIKKECGTCEYFSTRKDQMPCGKCLLNKAYISHWKIHPTIAYAFGEEVEHQKPVIFRTNKKKIEEAVKKTNESLDKGVTLPEAMEQLYEDLGVQMPDEVAKAMYEDDLKEENNGVSEETENQTV